MVRSTWRCGSLALLGLFCLAPRLNNGRAQTAPSDTHALEIVLTEPETVTPAAVEQWKREGFRAVAVVLDERRTEADYSRAVPPIAEGGMELYYWVEVARNPEMAKAHPRWMATLGMHQDWMHNFPNAPEPGAGEVAKAYPWVPIGYQESYAAHLERIGQLLALARGNWHGLFLNDLQGGPSSCGCGNPQCRWAIDYRTPSTASPISQDDVAAKFLLEVRKRAVDKLVVPVWTTECEEVDLPANKRQGRKGTGLCGTVGCATATCPQVFTRQWLALASAKETPIGLLALHSAFKRSEEFGGGPAWARHPVDYVNQTLVANGEKEVPPARLWVVVQGAGEEEERKARRAAAQAGVGAVIVARTKIEQGYEPRIVQVK